jgi:hypothetical protein
MLACTAAVRYLDDFRFSAPVVVERTLFFPQWSRHGANATTQMGSFRWPDYLRECELGLTGRTQLGNAS